jgi:hypothetical protein
VLAVAAFHGAHRHAHLLKYFLANLLTCTIAKEEEEEEVIATKMPEKSPRTDIGQPRHVKSNYLIANYEARVSGISREDREDLIPALALRSYHLPGYSYSADWRQYFGNNHPVFGICCHHRLHPLSIRMRLVNLIGSIVFGLAVTNILWIWFIIGEFDQDEAVLTIGVNGMLRTENTTGTDMQQAPTTTNDVYFSISQGRLLLWTVGGGLHALFDNTIYYFSVCICCLPGQSFEQLQSYQRYSHYFVVLTVVLITAAATLVVVLRAELESSSPDDDDQVVDVDLRQVHLGHAQNAAAYSFLTSYGTELALALFLYYPLVGTIFFSGVLGCGRLPILGGRPYEVAQEEYRMRKRNTPRNRTSDWTAHSSPPASENSS